MLASMSFDKGKAFYRSKFILSKTFVDEQCAEKTLYRRGFSKGDPRGGLYNLQLSIANVANTGVLRLGNDAFALYEAGLPYKFRLADLSTVGEERLNGAESFVRIYAHYRHVVKPDG